MNILECNITTLIVLIMTTIIDLITLIPSIQEDIIDIQTLMATPTIEIKIGSMQY